MPIPKINTAVELLLYPLAFCSVVGVYLENPHPEATMKIWVNEQLDPSGLVYSCIACCDETQALECHESFQTNLTETQKQMGWVARLRTVESWDDVPVSALKLS